MHNKQVELANNQRGRASVEKREILINKVEDGDE